MTIIHIILIITLQKTNNMIKSKTFVTFAEERKNGKMDIIKTKGCKRCGGDLFLERDYDGSHVICLQCGALYVKRPVSLKKNNNSKRVYAH
jgi:hypothetical protein